MTSDVEILLRTDNIEQRLDAMARITNTHELKLQLTNEEITEVFEKSRSELYVYGMDCWNFVKNYCASKFLLDTLLNNNINMFIALARACVSGKQFKIYCITDLVHIQGTINFSIGINRGVNESNGRSAIEIYKEFLDYNNFDISNLMIEDEQKIIIQQYQQEKYGGRLTKIAI